MNKKNKSLFVFVCVGIFSIILLVAITTSFYDYTLEKTGITNIENSNEYKYHIAMIVSNPESDFWMNVYEKINVEAKKHGSYVELMKQGINYEYTVPELIDMAISENVDAILLGYREEEDVVLKIEKARQNNIPVITLINDIRFSSRQSYIGINPYELGKIYASQLIKMTGDRKKKNIIALLNDNSPGSNQYQAFNQMNNILLSKRGPNRINIEKKVIPLNKAFETEKMVWDLFKHNDEPDIILCMSQKDTEAVYQTIIEKNRVGKTQIVGYYLSNTIVNAVENKIIAATVVLDTNQIANYAVQAAMESIIDGRTNSFFSVKLQLLTDTNIREYIEKNDKEMEI